MKYGLTDETPIPLKWAIGLLVAMGTVIGTALVVGMWASSVESNQKELQNRVEEFATKNERVDTYMRSIDSRLSNIEGRLGVYQKSGR